MSRRGGREDITRDVRPAVMEGPAIGANWIELRAPERPRWACVEVGVQGPHGMGAQLWAGDEVREEEHLKGVVIEE